VNLTPEVKPYLAKSHHALAVARELRPVASRCFKTVNHYITECLNSEIVSFSTQHRLNSLYLNPREEVIFSVSLALT
jgi:hypothetical protein